MPRRRRTAKKRLVEPLDFAKLLSLVVPRKQSRTPKGFSGWDETREVWELHRDEVLRFWRSGPGPKDREVPWPVWEFDGLKDKIKPGEDELEAAYRLKFIQKVDAA